MSGGAPCFFKHNLIKGEITMTARGRIVIKKAGVKGMVLLLSLLILGAGPAFSEAKDMKMSAVDIQKAYYASYNFEKDKKYDSAINALMPVYKDYPDYYTVNLRLGWLNYLNQTYPKSIDFYRKALEISPSSIEAGLGGMLPLIAQKKYAEVEAAAYKVLAIDRSNYYANLRLAYSLRMQQKYESAEKILNLMLALYPTDVSLLTELALDKEAREDYDSADNLYWSILILDPYNKEANDYYKEK
jgi:tetratricopeptide (TPR) repeat protein